MRSEALVVACGGARPDGLNRGSRRLMLTWADFLYDLDDGANSLFMDGSVRRGFPLAGTGCTIPTSDTEETFTWLPGERELRLAGGSYRGSHSKWDGDTPELATQGINPAMPSELDVEWRAGHDASIKLPNHADRE